MMLSLLIFTHLSTQLALCLGYASYVCKDSKGAVDVKVDLEASFNITYKMNGNLTGTAHLKLERTHQFDCQASESSRSLAVVFSGSPDLSRLIFSFSNKNASAFLDSVSVTYVPEGVNFPNSSQTESQSQAVLNKYLSANESSYFCPENQTINMSEIIMSISYLRIQAFGVKNGAFSSDDGLCGFRNTTTGNLTTTHMTTVSSTTSSTTAANLTTTSSPTSSTTAENLSTTNSFTPGTTTGNHTTTSSPTSTTTTAVLTTTRSTTSSTTTGSTTMYSTTPSTTAGNITTPTSTIPGNTTGNYTIASSTAITTAASSVSTASYTTASIPVTSTASYDNNTIVVRYSNGSVCLLMDADINLNFTFNGTETWYNGSVHYPAHGLSEGVVLTNGYCSGDSNWLNISWSRPNDTVTLGMMFKKNDSAYHLDTIVFQYFVDATATDLSISHLSAEVFSSTTSGLNLLKTSVDSYFCQYGPLAQELNLNGVLTLQNFTIQAFMDAKHDQIYGQDDGSCNPAPSTPAPTPAPDHTIPIVVGSSLGGLVIIIVIGFIAVRIRRRPGYKRLI